MMRARGNTKRKSEMNKMKMHKYHFITFGENDDRWHRLRDAGGAG